MPGSTRLPLLLMITGAYVKNFGQIGQCLEVAMFCIILCYSMKLSKNVCHFEFQVSYYFEQ